MSHSYHDHGRKAITFAEFCEHAKKSKRLKKVEKRGSSLDNNQRNQADDNSSTDTPKLNDSSERMLYQVLSQDPPKAQNQRVPPRNDTYLPRGKKQVKKTDEAAKLAELFIKCQVFVNKNEQPVPSKFFDGSGINPNKNK